MSLLPTFTRVLSLFLSCALMIPCAYTFEGGGVEDLTQLTLDSVLSSAGKKPVLLEFYAPWCKHCQLFAHEYHVVSETLKEEALVKRVDGDAHRTLLARFRVKGFPSFYLIHDGKVWNFSGPRAHDTLVDFVRSRGNEHGSQLKMFGGPLSPYWSVVTFLFQIVDRLKSIASAYKDRPLLLVAIIISALVAALFSLAVIIHVVTQPPRTRRRPHTD